MNGYVMNKSVSWRHAMKRSVGPGHKIPLDELYEQYGEKHDLKEGAVFVDWLRQIKLKDSSVWNIVYKDETTKKKTKVAKDEKAEDLTPPPMVTKELEVSDIVNMSVRKAREGLKKMTDLKLLTYAYNESRQLANKDTLCIMLRKRISELELTRR
ncbi:hypothetical protein LCGC14_2137570 [marine sediment metagenome]|uniref:Uncharacterized protein n=1 Tax=marine sediment metagenome TaxID=412755 RepID=A0A0F9DZD4_9ZZZZ